MIIALKIIFTLVIFLIICYPFIPMKGRLRPLSIASSLQYQAPHNRKNLFFVLLAIVEFIVVSIIFSIFNELAVFVSELPIIGAIISNSAKLVNSRVDYIFFVILMLIINVVVIYAFVIVKALLRGILINPIFGLCKKRNPFGFLKRKKKDKGQTDGEDDPEKKTDTEIERKHKRLRIPDFIHSSDDEEEYDDEDLEEEPDEDPEEDPDKKDPLVTDKKEDPDGPEKKKKKKKQEEREYGKVASAILSLFFEGEKFESARPWVTRARTILQIFIRLIEVIYAASLLVVLLSMFFELPMPVYNALVDYLHFRDWYVYPVISLIFLQEICNVFDAGVLEVKSPEQEREEDEEKEDKKREARLRALFALLKKRFDAEHSMRCYPELLSDELPRYKPSNLEYASALNYISNSMENTSGRVVQSYMECLDAIYSNEHVYFAASFYSELGEYLTAYTYISLQSGARMVFIVSDDKEKDTLRQFISDRLMRLTGSNAAAGWRVYTAEERLDQADVLIATPKDFIDNDIIEQYPAFFEETSNAIVIDADKTIALCSYTCSIIATKLKNATDGRIRFIFLTLDLLKGFAEGSLPRYFCIDKVLSFSSARENEAVSYILWNKESKKHRIYNKNGQKFTSLETIIAQLASRYGADGVRVITEAPLEHAERKILSLSGVEINNLYKNIVDVNYMIYSDDRCNLSAALYATTRFRGRKKSVVHILSKPYLLREYFMSRALTEDFINRSSFIQPRVTEHGERHKLSLLRIFCDASSESGMKVAEFERKVRDVIIAAKTRNDKISSAYCRNLAENTNPADMKLGELAAYLIAGLCDNEEIPADGQRHIYASGSYGNRAKDYYIITETATASGYKLEKEKYIIFSREREIYERLLACNTRVELRMHDNIIGYLDTFPSRSHLEYVEGQNIIFDNSEYEIERISEDGYTIYLRHENISIKNCLDTVHLRNYRILSSEQISKSAVLYNSTSALGEIKVTRHKAEIEATTYGFYSLTSDRQTLDFYSGVEGTPRLECPDIRNYKNTGMLRVSLKLRRECNDAMRLLMSAVFNEFIKTIFPHAYHCVAICPILEKPLSLCDGDISPIEGIKTLYPFITEPGEGYIETESDRMQFLFINDCREDIGVLDWFYDRSARYMQEFLANVYSYLNWLKLHKEWKHYIYFGSDKLPECYDLDGCCDALKDLNLVLSDDGKVDIETAGDDNPEEEIKRCSFCHKPMESGRFSFFDRQRFICTECSDVVDDEAQLEKMYEQVFNYLKEKYPEITFGAASVKFDPVYDLSSNQCLSEFYYRVDFNERTIYVELDNPINNVFVSIMRGIIALWQVDNKLSNQYAPAQMYYEELLYLRSIGEEASADWVYNALTDDNKRKIDAISDYVNGVADKSDDDNDDDPEDDPDEKIDEEPTGKEEPTDEKDEEDKSEEEDPSGVTDTEDDDPKPDNKKRTSFSFMRHVLPNSPNGFDFDGDDDDPANRLYNPNKVPRLLKRYLRGEHIDDGHSENLVDARDEGDEDEEDDPENDNADEGKDADAEQKADRSLTSNASCTLATEKRKGGEHHD